MVITINNGKININDIFDRDDRVTFEDLDTFNDVIENYSEIKMEAQKIEHPYDFLSYAFHYEYEEFFPITGKNEFDIGSAKTGDIYNLECTRTKANSTVIQHTIILIGIIKDLTVEIEKMHYTVLCLGRPMPSLKRMEQKRRTLMRKAAINEILGS